LRLRAKSAFPYSPLVFPEADRIPSKLKPAVHAAWLLHCFSERFHRKKQMASILVPGDDPASPCPWKGRACPDKPGLEQSLA
jgi:hypothetical protein